MYNRRNGAIIIVIILVVLGAGYFYMESQLSSAVNHLDVKFEGVNVRGLSLVPPEANLTLIYAVNNTNSFDFILSLHGELYYQSTLITPVTVRDQTVKAMGLSNVNVDVTITGNILQTFGGVGDKSKYHIEGELKATYMLLGVLPISIVRDLSKATIQ
jgi:hypothetical protein